MCCRLRAWIPLSGSACAELWRNNVITCCIDFCGPICSCCCLLLYFIFVRVCLKFVKYRVRLKSRQKFFKIEVKKVSTLFRRPVIYRQNFFSRGGEGGPKTTHTNLRFSRLTVFIDNHVVFSVENILNVLAGTLLWEYFRSLNFVFFFQKSNGERQAHTHTSGWRLQVCT